MSTQKELDPYSAKAENNDLTPQQKIEGLHSIVTKIKTGMLTTRSKDGHMHARAMAPAGRECPPFLPCMRELMPIRAAFDATQVTLIFIANKASHKFEEIENDAHVNVSFYDEKTTHWASYSGIARVSQDGALIDKHWSSLCVPLLRVGPC